MNKFDECYEEMMNKQLNEVRNTKGMADIHNKLDNQKDKDAKFTQDKKGMLKDFKKVEKIGIGYFAELDHLFSWLDATLRDSDKANKKTYYGGLHKHIDALEDYIKSAKNDLNKHS
jgi:hypothetical protein